MNFTHRDATNHGIDISKSRFDDIDKAIINFALVYKGKKVAVDIGCGSGRVSIILALMGFDVWLYDIQDMSDYFKRAGEALGISDKLHFTQCDISDFVAGENRKGRGDSPIEEYEILASFPDDIVIAISQRTLHHVKNNIAKKVLEKIKRKMISEGKIFFSISGINCKFAENYDCANSPLENRFCKVGELGKSTYSITGPVCLYEKQEVVDMLEDIGLEAEKLSESAFGNFKVIAEKK